MKRLLCAVAAMAMLVPAAASAQQNDRHHGNRNDQHQNRPDQHQSRPNRQKGQATPSGTRAPHGRPTIQPVPNRPSRPSRPEGRPTTQPVRPNRPVYQPGHRPSTFHRIRVGAFRYPRGYSYRRWAIGAVLPHIFLSNYYYWNDWAALGLLPPPPGFVWVRYGPDLLLVNRYTGRIADVIYGAFY